MLSTCKMWWIKNHSFYPDRGFIANNEAKYAVIAHCQRTEISFLRILVSKVKLHWWFRIFHQFLFLLQSFPSVFIFIAEFVEVLPLFNLFQLTQFLEHHQSLLDTAHKCSDFSTS